jgi:hypothetical protein
MVKLVAGASRLDVASEEPHFVTDFKRWSLFDLAIMEVSLGLYGIDEDGCELLVELAERFGECFC